MPFLESKEKKAVIVFDGWSDVADDYKTRGLWELEFRAIKKSEQATAVVEFVEQRQFNSIPSSYELRRQIPLFQMSQTREVRRTELSLAYRDLYEFFIEKSDRRKLIKITKGEWRTDEDGSRYWDDSSDQVGWLTCKQSMSLARFKNHINGSEIYGVFAKPRTGYYFPRSRYLMIDIDLHNQLADVFMARLRVLISHFHGSSHFQVSNENAGGVHQWLFFDDFVDNRRWLLNQLKELDKNHPECKFFKNGKLKIEVYPDSGNGHRLPLACGRTMLLDKPLEMVERRGKLRQDVIGYSKWLNDPDRDYMAKSDILDYITKRLDWSCAKSDTSLEVKAIPEVETPSKSFAKHLPSKTSDRISMKGKTRGAIIGFWMNGESGHFKDINTAIYITLMALHAGGLNQDEASEVAKRYIDEIPNDELSSRLSGDKTELYREVDKTSVKIWSPQNPNAHSICKWQAINSRWRQIGFFVEDKTSWNWKTGNLEVVIDCEQVEFSPSERLQIIGEMAPLLVGQKQALKVAKQDVVINAVAYFLRYVRCCDREIPINALPKILSDFDLKLQNHDKQSGFFKLLRKWDWIYCRAEHNPPFLNGTNNSQGRARAYGIGAAMAGKLGNSPLLKQQNNNGSIYLSPIFAKDSEVETIVTCFEVQVGQAS